MKPFNLEAALAGEPVKLRNGKKAYVRHHEREHYTCRPLVGYLENAFGGVWLISWTRSGRADIESNDALNDIIGMWPRTITIGDMEVPEPEREPLEVGQNYYIPIITSTSSRPYLEYHWEGRHHELVWLRRGLIHLAECAAIQHAEALVKVSGGA